MLNVQTIRGPELHKLRDNVLKLEALARGMSAAYAVCESYAPRLRLLLQRRDSLAADLCAAEAEVEFLRRAIAANDRAIVRVGNAEDQPERMDAAAAAALSEPDPFEPI